MKLSTLVALTATKLPALHGARAAGADEILNKSGCMVCHTKDASWSDRRSRTSQRSTAARTCWPR
jgi:cytochrome c551/c552